MTREEAMEYRRSCPHDAMGDFSIFEQVVSAPNMKEIIANSSTEDK